MSRSITYPARRNTFLTGRKYLIALYVPDPFITLVNVVDAPGWAIAYLHVLQPFLDRVHALFFFADVATMSFN